MAECLDEGVVKLTSSKRENMSLRVSDTARFRYCAKSSRVSLSPLTFLALLPYSHRTSSLFLGFNLQKHSSF